VDRRHTEVEACETALPKAGVEEGSDYRAINGDVLTNCVRAVGDPESTAFDASPNRGLNWFLPSIIGIVEAKIVRLSGNVFADSIEVAFREFLIEVFVELFIEVEIKIFIASIIECLATAI
jgi:hypothetical protein